jgi:protein-S-isoprenylcysteine O-methyltransferase Ste14
MERNEPKAAGINPLWLYGAVAAAAIAGALFWKSAQPAPGEWIWIAGFVLQGIIRAPHQLRNQKVAVARRPAGLGETIMLMLMFITMMVLPLVHLSTPLFAAYDYRLPEAALYLGAVLQIMFLYYFWRSHADLGTQWSATLEVREGHRLVTRGVYGRMRHPMYLAIWLGALAQPFLVQNWIAGPAVVLAFALMYFVRVPYEEAMMHETFGSEWDEYAARTPRLSF